MITVVDINCSIISYYASKSYNKRMLFFQINFFFHFIWQQLCFAHMVIWQIIRLFHACHSMHAPKIILPWVQFLVFFISRQKILAWLMLFILMYSKPIQKGAHHLNCCSLPFTGEINMCDKYRRTVLCQLVTSPISRSGRCLPVTFSHL